MKKIIFLLVLFNTATLFAQETTFTSPGYEEAENINGEWNLVLEDNNLLTEIIIKENKMIFSNSKGKTIVYNLKEIKENDTELMKQMSGNLNTENGKEVLVILANNAFHLMIDNKIYSYKNIQ